MSSSMASLVAPLSLAILMVSGCAGVTPGSSSAGGSNAITVQVVKADTTTIDQSFTFTGDVKPSSSVDVLPKQSGRIVSEPVSVGSVVKAGDTIAQLDHVALDLSLEQAQAQLQGAQAKLATIQAGPRAENVAIAQVGVDNAQQKLQAMLNGSRQQQIDQAQQAVNAAQARLGALTNPRPETVAQARLSVQQAQEKLDALQHPRPETVQQAQLSLDQVKQKLATVQAAGRPEAIGQAQSNLQAAQARLQALKNGLRPEDVTTLQLAVSQAKNALLAAQATRDGLCNVPYSHVQFQCDAAQAQVNAAQTAVDQANANLAAKTAAPAQTDLQQAQAAVDQAQQALQLAKSPYTAQDLQQAQNAVSIAQQQLALAQKPASPQDLAQAQNGVGLAQQQLALASRPGSPQDVAQAQAAVAQAQDQLSLARQPYTDQDIALAKNAVAQAQQQLALAKQPYTEQDAQAAQAVVAQAQAAVDSIKQSIRDTTVTAPIDGVVTQKSLDVGAMAAAAGPAPSTPIVTIATQAVKVQVPVDASQVTFLKQGQPATITGGSLGAASLPAVVTTIYPTGDPKNRTFAVDLAPKEQAAQLLPGTFVRVIVTTAEHQNVTAVPNAAVVQRAGKSYVFSVQDSVARLVPVGIGLASDQMTEITSGISPGAAVVVQGQQDLNDGDRVKAVAGQPLASAGQG